MSTEIVELVERATPYVSAAHTAAEEPGDTDATGALRHQLKSALWEDADLVRELAVLLPGQGAVTVHVSGTRAIGAQHIGIAASGDNATIHPPQR
ncbi:hypothetical protein ABZ192_00980 [Streptomyces sp. NPDC006235]|uniref:hypothetical protein n=1 Tax=Streptomyces sp. NPDC006235 TaxID=3156736 RepID=UPI00339F2C3B